MSEKLLSNQAALNQITTIAGYVFLAWVIVFVLCGIACLIASKKRAKIHQEKLEDEKVFQDKYLELSKQKEELGELKYEKYVKRIDKKYSKNRDKYTKRLGDALTNQRKVDSITSKVNYLLLSILVFIALVIVFTNFHVGGRVGELRKVNDQGEGLVVTAFYEVKYEDIQKVTITAFVKNNTDHGIQNAKIKIKNADMSADVFAIEPGEEKIVSFVVYPVKNKNYEFEIIIPEEGK